MKNYINLLQGNLKLNEKVNFCSRRFFDPKCENINFRIIPPKLFFQWIDKITCSFLDEIFRSWNNFIITDQILVSFLFQGNIPSSFPFHYFLFCQFLIHNLQILRKKSGMNNKFPFWLLCFGKFPTRISFVFHSFFFRKNYFWIEQRKNFCTRLSHSHLSTICLLSLYWTIF